MSNVFMKAKLSAQKSKEQFELYFPECKDQYIDYYSNQSTHVQKIFKFKKDTANAIKLDAANRTVMGGKRVTEREIVEGLVRQYYRLGAKK